MRDRCSVCNLKFEREEGYFLGAMYLSFSLALLMICALAAILWWLTIWPITRIFLGAVLLFVPFAPTLSLVARVLWIYLDQAIDPEQSRT